MIKLNKVTWYTRFIALVLFLAVIPALSFYIGTQYGLMLGGDQSQQVTKFPATAKKHSISVTNVQY